MIIRQLYKATAKRFIFRFVLYLKVLVIYEIALHDIFHEITIFTLLLYICIGAFVAGILFDMMRFAWKYLRSGTHKETKTKKSDKEIQQGEDIVQNFYVGDEMIISRSEFMRLQTELMNLNRIVQNAVEKFGERLDR